MKNLLDQQLKEFDEQIDKMFKDRFITDTKLFKWAGKKQFKEFLKQFLTDFYHKIRKAERDKIKKDLLKIADKGELEELRREVINYFL